MSKAQTPTVYAEQEQLSSWSSKGFFYVEVKSIQHLSLADLSGLISEYFHPDRQIVLLSLHIAAVPYGVSGQTMGRVSKISLCVGMHDIKGSQLFMSQHEGHSLSFHEECLTSPCWVVIDCSVSSKSGTDSPRWDLQGVLHLAGGLHHPWLANAEAQSALRKCKGHPYYNHAQTAELCQLYFCSLLCNAT